MSPILFFPLTPSISHPTPFQAFTTLWSVKNFHQYKRFHHRATLSGKAPYFKEYIQYIPLNSSQFI